MTVSNLTMVDSDAGSVVSSMISGFSLVGRRNHGRGYDQDNMSITSKAKSKVSLFRRNVAVVAETSSDEEDDLSIAQCHEFIVQCNGGETVFVTAAQGKQMLKRCPALRNLVLEAYDEGKGPVINKSSWTASNVRRLIEVLTSGSSWIDNEARLYEDFQKFSKELGLDIRLTSLINYNDLLPSSTAKTLFKLLNLEHYQFKLTATVKSSQWLYLLNKGILLMSNSKLLCVKMADFPTKRTKGNESNEERLAKCDSICSDFRVYAIGNMQAVLFITRILSPPPVQKNQVQEPIKLIFKVRKGCMPFDDLVMLWRMSDSSLAEASTEDQALLQSLYRESLQSHRVKFPDDKNMSMPLSVLSDHHSDVTSHTGTITSESMDHPSPIGMHALTTKTTSPVPNPASDFDGYQYFSFVAQSFVALKHLFEPINMMEPGLEACLVVPAPSPDALGRLINAVRQTATQRMDMDLQQHVYYTCQSSADMKAILAYMGNYSSSAVISGEFHLCQRRE